MASKRPDPPGKPPSAQGVGATNPDVSDTVSNAPRITKNSASDLSESGYHLLDRIGMGNFGEVWKAQAPGGVPVAVKIISRPVEHEHSKRELQSLELTREFRHPFLLQTQAFWIVENRVHVAMELADGSLRDLLEQRKKDGKKGIPADELTRLFLEASEAIDYLHKNGVTHRDIKPENILLLQGHVKVADFGLARWQEFSEIASATGCGTPAFMAPEVWRGKLSPHSDQYSLAVAYCELRLDRRLYPAANFVEMMTCHMEKMPDLNPIAEPEQKVLFKALAKEPGKRFESCLAFAHALKELMGSASVSRVYGTIAGDHRIATKPSIEVDHKKSNIQTSSSSASWRTQRSLKPGKFRIRTLAKLLLLLLVVGGIGFVAFKYEDIAAFIEQQKFDDVGSRVRSKADEGLFPEAVSIIDASTLGEDRKDFLRNQVLNAGLEDAKDLLKQNQDRKVEALTDQMLQVFPDDAKVLEIRRLVLARIIPQEIPGFIKDQKFETAWKRLQLLESPEQSRLRSSLLDAWKNHVTTLVSQNAIEKALPHLQTLHAYVPNDKDTTALYNEVRARKSRNEIEAKIAKGEYTAAFAALTDKASPFLDTPSRSRLKIKLRDAWQARAAKASSTDQKIKVLREIQNHYPADTAIIKKLNEARREQLALLTESASKQWEQRELVQLQETLLAAKKLNVDTPQTRLELDGLQALLWARYDNPDAAKKQANRKQAVAELQRLLKNPKAPRQLELCLALDDLAKLGLTGETEALAALKKIRPGLKGTAAEEIGRRIEFWLNREYATLIREARGRIDAKNYSDIDKMLNRAEKIAPASLKFEVSLLRVQVGLNDPKRSSQTRQTIDLIKQILAQPKAAAYWPELARSLVSIAKSKPQYLDESLTILNGLVVKMEPGQARDEITRTIRGFAGQGVRKQIAGFTPKTDWHMVLAKCRDADKTGWIQACMIECLIEKNQGKLTKPDRQEVAGLARSALLKDAGSYGIYVQGLANHAMGMDEVSAQLMVKAFAQPDKNLMGFRREHAIAILREAAIPASDWHLPGKPLVVPYEMERAKEVASWLAKALDLQAAAGLIPSTEMQVLYVLALYELKDFEKLLPLVNAIVKLPKLDQRDIVPLRLAQAEAEAQRKTKAGWRGALAAYTDLADRLQAIAKKESQAAQEIYAKVLEPGIRAGAQLAAGPGDPANRQLARLHVEVGDLVGAHYDKPGWPFPDPRKQAVASYSAAIKRDGKVALYYVKRADAVNRLANHDLAMMEEDAQKALELDNRLPDAHRLKGYVLLLQSRKKQPADRAKLLQEALQANDVALKLYKLQTDQTYLPDLLTTRSTNCTELANFTNDPAKQADLLHQAVANAETALKRKDRSFPEYAWSALGIAREDLALLIEEDPVKNYAASVDAFTQAVNLRRTVPKLWLDLGRCRFNQGMLTKSEPTLQKARDDLDQAVSLTVKAHGNSPTAVGAEAYYWRARVAVAVGDFESAKADYQKAVQAAQQLQSVEWPTYALGFAEDALKHSRDLQGIERTAWLEVVRQHAQEAFNKDLLIGKSGWLLGRTFELEGKYKEAYDTYLKALPLDQVDVADLHFVSLLASRANLLLTAGPSLKIKEYVDLARKDALRAVKLAETHKSLSRDHSFVGRIYGTCGLAHLSAAIKGSTIENYNKAYSYLTKAKKKAPEHANVWIWNMGIAQTYAQPLVNAKLKPSTAAAFKKWQNSAVKYAELARTGAPKAEKVRIEKLIKKLKNLRFQ